MLFSLLGVAAAQLPDSLLTFDKAYYYNIVDMPKSLQIVQTGNWTGPRPTSGVLTAITTRL